MASRRYTIVVANRETGVVHRVTVRLRPALAVACAVLSLPVLVGMGARWSALAEIQSLRVSVATREMENASYRAATYQLTTQIQSIETAISELTSQAALDPDSKRALEKLPSLVRNRALGGGSQPAPVVNSLLSPALASPEDTFGMVRDLLGRLESRLQIVRSGVERRAALAAATPSIWPAIGWLSGSFGRRNDPFSGESGQHTGIDISLNPGEPVYATAAGTVDFAGTNGAYGKMVALNHGFGLVTRYAHLSRVTVGAGDRVERGRIIGYSGATGRTTGPHLHYELLVNGQFVNPLRLLAPAPK